jgi:hypothetical protein
MSARIRSALIRAAAYYRMGDDRQENSLERQRAQVTAYAEGIGRTRLRTGKKNGNPPMMGQGMNDGSSAHRGALDPLQGKSRPVLPPSGDLYFIDKRSGSA